jgi:hypothetical protein
MKNSTQKLLISLMGILLLCGIAWGQQPDKTLPRAFNQKLADQLAGMAAVDQQAAWIPVGKFKSLSEEEWNAFKDSVFTTHKIHLETIFYEWGYPGYNLVGTKGEQHFWLMVQHADADPHFQTKVLEALAIAVNEGNADGRNYGLLLDRVKLNTGQKQVYGTQVSYHLATGQAYPKPLEDSTHVNERRASIGLEPLEEYLNHMTRMHFEMNKDYMIKQGINIPKLYPLQPRSGE